MWVSGLLTAPEFVWEAETLRVGAGGGGGGSSPGFLGATGGGTSLSGRGMMGAPGGGWLKGPITTTFCALLGTGPWWSL